ncbi:hypothetical protein [Peribacillus cavernae]|uniref:hypothetical protein n=1 Tax=Peribacillus cavernae TaxID=1674310 RepID=UPI00163D0605|nr:hypothetical protein [Peribacillus cavernae]MDQ0221360.1 hypothetical protein [Peribacillus cavernae]
MLEDGDDIRVKKGKYLPDSITASIGDNKREILAILEMNGELALWLPFRGNSTLLL